MTSKVELSNSPLSQQKTSPQAWAVSISLILLATCLAYCNSFTGAFVFDDIGEIQQNPVFIARGTIWAASTQGHHFAARPLPYLTFFLNYLTHGDHVLGYHLVNLAIHILNATLVLAVVNRCLVTRPSGHNTLTSPFVLSSAVALLWCVHPINTQSVTYIYQRIELMYSTCLLLVILCLSYSHTSRAPIAWLAASSFACACGMFCKEVMVVAPLAAIWFDRAFLSPSWRSLLARRWGYYCMLFSTYLLLYLVTTQQKYDDFSLDLPDKRTGFQHLLTQPAILMWYFRLCFVPVGQNFEYGWPIVETLDQRAWLGLPIIGLLACVLWLMPRQPRLAFLVGMPFLLLGPTSSILPIFTVAAEHRMYLPSVAVITGAVLLVEWLSSQAGMLVGIHHIRRASGLVLVLTIPTLSGLTIARNHLYQDRLLLWRDSVNKAPQSWYSNAIVGGILIERGLLREALPYTRKSLEAFPTTSAKFDHGLALLATGDGTAARKLLGQAIADHHSYLSTLNQIGLFFRQTDPEMSVLLFEAVVGFDANQYEAHNNLGALISRSNPQAAAAHFHTAIAGNPRNVQAYNNLANLLARQGDLRGAISQYERALAIDPNFAAARTNLEIVRQQLNAQPTKR